MFCLHYNCTKSQSTRYPHCHLPPNVPGDKLVVTYLSTGNCYCYYDHINMRFFIITIKIVVI